MEIEMKALCRSDQIYKLFENKFNNFTKVGTNIDKLLFKSDRYYSWGGEQLPNPKKIYRVRTEAEIARLVDADGAAERVYQTQKFFDSENIRQDDHSKYSVFLTYKEHNILPDGSQNNIENESRISFEAAETFDIIMKSMGFDIYFTKSKKSCSMYYMSNKNGLVLHCEIVKVNSLPVYLEVEFVIDDDKAIDDERKRISDTIKEFFQELGIACFEPRNWKQLIEA